MQFYSPLKFQEIIVSTTFISQKGYLYLRTKEFLVDMLHFVCLVELNDVLKWQCECLNPWY